MVDLSVIVPVFNVEQFLEKCILSLTTSLDMRDIEYEIIIVNDGSTDSSGHVARNLTERFSKQILLIEKENGGLSSARNFGLERAKGKYVFFMDSDDYVHENFYISIKEALHYNVDVLSFGIQRVDEFNNRLKTVNGYKEKGVISGAEFLVNNVISSGVWRYIIKRDIIVNNKLFFVDGIFHEDEAFTTLLMTYIDTIIYKNIVLYNYVKREGSILNNNDKSKYLKKINDMIFVINVLKKRRDEFKDDRLEKSLNYYKGLSKKIEQLALSVLLKFTESILSRSEKIDILKKMKASQMFPLTCNHLPLKQKIYGIYLNTRFNLELL